MQWVMGSLCRQATELAVDSDGDGKRDIWNSRADAIGSVANYLSAHNWEKGAGVATRVQLDSDSRELPENLFSDIRPNLTGSQLLKKGLGAIYIFGKNGRSDSAQI